MEEDDVAGHLQRSRNWLGVAEQAYEEYHFEQAGVAAAIASAHAQIATALNC
jgi:hypothetical protein